MPTYQRPGVYVNETLASLNTGQGVTADATAAFVGAGKRGTATPTLVGDWSEFTTLFGDISDSDYLAQAVFSHFSNGGSEAYVARVAPSDAVTATRSLNDTASEPIPTLKIDAASPGAYGNSIYLDVSAGYTAGRFDLVVKFGGTGSGSTVETFADLSMNSTDSRYAPTIINASSRYVVATDLLSVTASPNNAPAVQTGVALATGADGGTIDDSDYTAVVSTLANIPVPLVLNLPGVTDATTVNSAIAFAEAQGSVFVVVDAPKGNSVAQVATYAQSLTASSYAALYYPWVEVSDPTKVLGGGTKLVPPGGAVVGQFIATDAQKGPFKTPAGVSNRLAGAVGLEIVLQPTDYDTLNTSNPPVNVIKPVPGYGLCVFGGRTLKGGYADKYVAVRRSLIYLEKSLNNLTQFAIFEANDSRLWDVVKTKVDGFLSAYWARGGLRGASPAQAYYVKCDATNNTLADIQNGTVNVEVGVALEYPTEFIVIRLGQFENGSSTVSTTL